MHTIFSRNAQVNILGWYLLECIMYEKFYRRFLSFYVTPPHTLHRPRYIQVSRLLPLKDGERLSTAIFHCDALCPENFK